MTDSSKPDRDVSLGARIDEICEQFELALQDGEQPDIEEYLHDWHGSQREQLRVELTRLLNEYESRQNAETDATVDRRLQDTGPIERTDDPPAPPCDVEPIPGHIGRYRVQRLLGEGGFGKVYLAIDDKLGRAVAVKVPKPEYETFAAMYLNEASIVAKLDHPHIVPVYDVGEAEGFPFYLVSKYVEGSDLAEWIERGDISIHTTASIVATAAETLNYAHEKGLVHRDVKPGNILIDLDNSPFVVDFGLALRDAELGAGPEYQYLGTPAYMSPEQARGEGHRVDQRSDIFSLGIVLYELLTERKPFRGKTKDELVHQICHLEPDWPEQVRREIPDELKRICLKALSKRASERYTTAIELAKELGAWQQESPDVVAEKAQIAITDSTSVQIVPKGLRSFDEHDADFFLELLPGPRDRDGLPESLRFWKTRIEECEAEKTFRVGLLYGPSGCGKTSLVKAGLLPRLASFVTVVYVEATDDGTESRLLNGLRRNCAGLPKGLDLQGSISALRHGRGVAAEGKVLIVLDQCEQWLHSHSSDEHSQLVQSLRQCDGENVQALVLARGDYYVGASQLFQELDEKLIQGHNQALVNLFHTDHATKVLKLIGRAYHKLPEGELSAQQVAFLDSAIGGLTEDGKVISVRLAIFAEMMKGRAWTKASLKEVGGTRGVGMAFLEETFASNTAPPHYRRHEKGVRAILNALLPEEGADIKGRMQSHVHLQEVAGYADRPNDFKDLIDILDRDIRLVTPSELEDTGEKSTEGRNEDSRFYQLSHDYLIPSLREWLTRRQQETRRGRAELRLAERAALWNAKPENRHLPSLLEDIRIRALTRSKEWTQPQQAMMRKAGKLHFLRVTSAMVIMLLVIAGGLYTRNRLRDREAKRLVDQVLTADIGNLQTPLQQLADVRDLAEPQLRTAFQTLSDESAEKLNVSLALLGSEPEEQITFLRKRLPALLPSQVRVIRQALSESSLVESVADDLWSDLTSGSGEDAGVLPLASTLAVLTPSDPRWSEAGSPVTEALVGADTVYLGGWLELLKDVRKELLPKLSQICGDDSDDGDPTQRKQATAILRRYAFDQPKLLSELLLVGDEEQFKQLFPLAAKPENGSSVLSIMRRELAKKTTYDWKDPPEDPAWQTPPPEAVVAIEAADGMLDAEKRFAFCQTMPWATFLEVADQLRTCGFRPTRVRPFVDGEELRVAAMWLRDGGTWDIQQNLTPAQLPRPDKMAEKDGMLPIDLSAYRPSSTSKDKSPELRYLLVWGPPESADEQRRVSYGLTEQQLEQVHAKLKQEKFAAQATLQVSVDGQGQRRYTGIWSNQGAEGTPVPAYAGWQRVDQLQWDISLAAAGRLPDPLDLYRRQLAAIEQASPEQTDSPNLRLTRAVANYHLGNTQAALDDLDFLSVRDTSNVSVDHYRTLALARHGKADEARSALDALCAQYENQAFRGCMQVMVFAWLGEVEAAQKSLDDVVAIAESQSEAFFSACAAAQASLALTEHDADNAQVFRERAFDMLRKAEQAGFRDVEQICGDPDLAPLHSQRQFAELVNSMAPPARYATLLRANTDFESQLLSDQAPAVQLQHARSLIAVGYRPIGITVACLEGSGAEAASVWIRPLVPDEDTERLALRQANAAVALARFEQAQEVWPLLKHSLDPRLRSYVIDRLASFGADPAVLWARYQTETERSIRRALLLALGNFAAANLLTPTQREGLDAWLMPIYRDDPDSGIHGATEWTLRQLGLEREIEAAKAALATGQAVGGRQWYVTKTGGLTLTVIRPDGPFLMGAPVWEAEREGGPAARHGTRHSRAIPRQYAIGTHEVTVAQFELFRANHESNRQYAREETAPANRIGWYDAAAFCNWLSREEGIPKHQWCYDPSQGFSDGMNLYPNYLSRTGYRLPTEAEWEYACRAGAVTARYYGETATLLDRYAWYRENSQQRWMLPVGSMRPNDFGVFDMLGNAYEWCQDKGANYPSDQPLVEDSEQTDEVRDTDRRVLRGGSFGIYAAIVRSACRNGYVPGNRSDIAGFRVARTYNVPSFNPRQRIVGKWHLSKEHLKEAIQAELDKKAGREEVMDAPFNAAMMERVLSSMDMSFDFQHDGTLKFSVSVRGQDKFEEGTWEFVSSTADSVTLKMDMKGKEADLFTIVFINESTIEISLPDIEGGVTPELVKMVMTRAQ